MTAVEIAKILRARIGDARGLAAEIESRKASNGDTAALETMLEETKAALSTEMNAVIEQLKGKLVALRQSTVRTGGPTALLQSIGRALSRLHPTGESPVEAAEQLLSHMVHIDQEVGSLD